MFDKVTADLIRSAPALPGLDPALLPKMLTERYAEMVARRLRRAEGETASTPEKDDEWPLARIADTYELIASIHDESVVRRAAAFVAATAQQLLAQDAELASETSAVPLLDRDNVDPALAATLLFLAAEQYADASDAARQIRIAGRHQLYVVTLLAEDVRDLALGKLGSILERAIRRPRYFGTRDGLEARGVTALFESLLVGVELLAAEVLGEPVPARAADRFDSADAAFARVLALSSNLYDSRDAEIGTFLTTYPGPRHFASLLLMAYGATAGAAVTKIGPPPGADHNFWKAWLRRRADTAPFVWRNHRDAIEKGFHVSGASAVIVLPTGAGKTTVSCVKMAGVLASGKNVVFIAPTHALVDQLTEDLREIFPEDLLGSLVSSEFDRLFAAGTALRKIEVMTPERCLALLSYAPYAFEDVGLLVFDECHLLSPLSGLRRALDGMFCVLAFNNIAPNADLLFLSAMIRNGGDFAAWVRELTGRECVFVDLLWKPSRQARGIVFYERTAIHDIHRAAVRVQHDLDVAKHKTATGLRKAAKAQLLAEPFAIFGLQHNWLHRETIDVSIAKISGEKVQLNGELRHGGLILQPNVNGVAAQIATASARGGLKAIVFVNVKLHAVSTARDIAAALGRTPTVTPDETERWTALEVELGGLEHSFLNGPSVAVPHNASMLPLERNLAERMFRRDEGAQVIVATPTLAQGLNLPAHLAILASDKRADPEEGGRTDLAAHEILNAAARAGRAGHLANGMVLLIPEAILTRADGKPFSSDIIQRLQSILPEDDRCIDMIDPLQVVLDRISVGAMDDADVEYALNRFSTVVAPEGVDTAATAFFSIDKSFAAFMAARRRTVEAFNAQVVRLKEILGTRNAETEDTIVLELAARSGAPVSALSALRERLAAIRGVPPDTIPGWISWTFDWLVQDERSRLALLNRESRAILGAVGRKMDSGLTQDAIRELLPGVFAWLYGKPVCEIEVALGGSPDLDSECPRARHLITEIVPLGLSFVIGLLARTARETGGWSTDGTIPRSVIDCLPTAARRGFDTPAKVAFAEVRKGLLSRVQIHRAFVGEVGESITVSNTDDYASVLRKVRLHLA